MSPLPSLMMPSRLLALAALIPLLFAVVHFGCAPPVISHDSAIGWQTWRSMQAGADWNQILWPDPDDIARSKGGYLVWWTPGQYLPLGLLTELGLSLGRAALLTSLLGAWSLAFGAWRLCLALGTGDRGAALAALAAAATWHTIYAFGFYIGGEIVQLALWPWIVLAAWRTRHRSGWQPVVLPLLFLLGSYAKLSFTIYAAALLMFLWLEEGRAAAWKGTALARAGLRLACAGLVYVAGWYWLHLGRGASPAAAGGPAASVAEILGFAMGGPWYATCGFTSVLGRLTGSGALAEHPGWVRWLLFSLGLAGFAGTVQLVFAKTVLLRLAGIVSLVAGGALGAMLLRGNAVSFEDRHLRPAGILLLAAGAAVAGDAATRPPVRRTMLAALALAIAFGVGAGGQRILNLRRQTLRAPNDIAALNLDAPALRQLERLDRPDQLICLSDIMHAPLLSRARVLLADGSTVWHGRVAHLALMLPAGRPVTGGPERFVDYGPAEWRLVQDGPWQFWSAPAHARPAYP